MSRMNSNASNAPSAGGDDVDDVDEAPRLGLAASGAPSPVTPGAGARRPLTAAPPGLVAGSISLRASASNQLPGSFRRASFHSAAATPAAPSTPPPSGAPVPPSEHVPGSTRTEASEAPSFASAHAAPPSPDARTPAVGALVRNWESRLRDHGALASPLASPGSRAGVVGTTTALSAATSPVLRGEAMPALPDPPTSPTLTPAPRSPRRSSFDRELGGFAAAGAPLAELQLGLDEPGLHGDDAHRAQLLSGASSPTCAGEGGLLVGGPADAPCEPSTPEPRDLARAFSDDGADGAAGATDGAAGGASGANGTVAVSRDGTSFGSALDALRALVPTHLSLGDLQLYQHACGHEGRFVPMLIERAYAALGVRVARNPVLTIVLSMVLVVCLSFGLVFARYETEPERLYVPQFSPLGMQRKYIDDTFGVRPQPGIFVVTDREPGGNVLTRDHVRAIFSLHEAVAHISVGWRTRAHGADARGGGGGFGELLPWRQSGWVDRELSYDDLCARRYFNMVQDSQCLSSSILRLWLFSRSAFEEDAQWEQTVRAAYDESLLDFGPELSTLADENGTTHLRAQALQLSYYYNASMAEYSNGGMVAWELALIAEVARINEQDPAIRLSYWSAKLNEKDASSVATKDLDVLCMTFAFILLYVCVTLGGFTLDRRRSRMALGGFCGICTAASLTSGFGICCYIGVPLAPMSTLVLFTMLGVSVDDMVIIVDAFDRTSTRVSLEERIRVALSHAGTAVTMTSATTMVAFLSGVCVDLPSIQLFCAPAAASVLMVNVLQVTLFTALLVLDARRQEMGKLDCQSCLPHTLCVGGGERKPGAVGVASGGRDARANGGAYASPQPRKGADAAEPSAAWSGETPQSVNGVSEDEIGCTNSALGRYWRHHYAEWLMQWPVRVAVLVAFAALLIVAAVLIPHIELGLPMEATLPADSAATTFFRDVNRYWTGTQDFQVMLVIRDTDLTSDSALANIDKALAELAALPFILDIVTNWMDDYAAYENCTAVARTGVPLAHGARTDFSGLKGWLADGGVRFCRYDPDFDSGQADGPAGGNATALARAREEGGDGDGDGARRQLAAALAARAPRARAPYPPGGAAPDALLVGGGGGDSGGARVGALGLGRRRLRETAAQAAARRAAALAEVQAAIAAAEAAEAADADADAYADAATLGGGDDGAGQPQPVADGHIVLLGRSSGGGARTAPSRAAVAAAAASRSLRPPLPSPSPSRSLRPPPAGPPPSPPTPSPSPPPSRSPSALVARSGGSTAASPSNSPFQPTRVTSPAPAPAPVAPSRRRRGSAPAPSPAPRPAPAAAAPTVAHGALAASSASTAAAPSPTPSRRRGHGRQPAPKPRSSPAPGAAVASAPAASSHGKAGKACVDANRQFMRLSGGYACSNATDYCLPGQPHWRIVSSYCPLTCGKCVPEPLALGSASDGVDDGADELGSSWDKPDFEVVDGGLGAASDVRLDPANPNHVVASRFILTAVMPKVILEAYPQHQQINAVLRRNSIDGYVYHYRYEFGVCDQAMPRLCLRNLLVAAIGILITVTVFLPIRLALLSTATVVMIDVLLLGVMVIYHVRLHCMTTVTLLIALGLAIDYSCHLAHAYETSPLPTQLEKVKHACSTMGLSILNAGASTLLGTGFMALSETPVFQTVFVLVWNTVFFGLMAGLMFVPVVLSLVGGGVHKSKALQLLGMMENEGSFVRRAHSHAGASTGASFAHRRHIPMA